MARDPDRHGGAVSDEAPAPGRRRLGQDGRGRAGHADGGRSGLSGGVHGADRDPRRAALQTLRRLLAAARGGGRAPHQRREGQGASRADRRRGRRAPSAVSSARTRSSRRASRSRGSAWRWWTSSTASASPARGAAGQGRGSRRARDDRHADSAHARAHPLRRPRRLGARRAAAGPAARRTVARGEASAADLRVPARAGRGGAAGVRRVPARRGVRGDRPARRHGDGRAACSGRCFRSCASASSTGAWRGREGARDARLREGGDPRPRLDDGDRGRHRRPERDRDADRARGALRAGAAPPAPRARGPRALEELLHPADGRARRRTPASASAP